MSQVEIGGFSVKVMEDLGSMGDSRAWEWTKRGCTIFVLRGSQASV